MVGLVFEIQDLALRARSWISIQDLPLGYYSICNSIKWGELAIKRPARWGSFSKIPLGRRPEGILLNDPNQAGRLIANHLFLCYSFVISCLRKFRLFSQAVDVKPGLFRTNQTWFDVNGGTVRLVKINLMSYISWEYTCENKRNSRKQDIIIIIIIKGLLKILSHLKWITVFYNSRLIQKDFTKFREILQY